MAGTVLEALLLIRILSLKLQRVYLWITLYWAASLIFDTSQLAMGLQSKQAGYVWLYSSFLFAVIYPLTGWDVFEEMKASIGKLRLLHGSRMITVLFSTVLIMAILAAFLSPSDADAADDAGVADFGPLVAFIAAAACTFFLLSLRKLMSKQALATPRNTRVWLNVFLILMGCDALEGLVQNFVLPFVAKSVAQDTLDGINLVFALIASVATLWALIRVRAISSDASAAPQQARL